MTDSYPNPTLSFPILIVDDDHLLRRILETSLKAAGYEVVAAENGKDALELFKNQYFPIVMTDWIMPEMDGLELCRAIRNEVTDRYTFIILLTSLDSKNDVIAGLESGADEYLVKPVNQTELKARLKTARRILDLENNLQKSLEEIRSLSLVDPVTGTYNRRFMDDRINQEIKRAYRYEHSLALILISINNFAQISETCGYYSGDLVLKGCADCLVEAVRKDVDWLVRYGDEEFLVVLPETDAAGAMIVAKRLRIRIATMAIKIYANEIRVTASFGVASFTASRQKLGVTAQLLLDKADQCLHQAREDGTDSIKGIQLS
ncbi:MAG: diguanylate cyclase response regulator [Geobacter sp.]|nr:MAG: diguanylate cyclase response regulator [Geobacter sp.]